MIDHPLFDANATEQDDVTLGTDHPEIGPVRRVFWHAAGIERAVLSKREYWPERRTYDSYGALVLFVTITATISGGHFAYTVSRTYFGGIVGALLFGFFTYHGERLFLRTLRGADADSLRHLWMGVWRVAVASFISFFTALMAVTWMFDPEVRVEQQQMRNTTVQNATTIVDARLQPEIDRIRAELATLQGEVRDAVSAARDARADATRELDGSGGTGRTGNGAVFKEKDRLAAALEAEAALIKQRVAAPENVLLDRLDSMGVVRSREIATVESAAIAADSPLSRFEALVAVMRKRDAARFLSLMIILGFVLLDTTPVMTKLLSRTSMYDDRVQAERHLHRQRMKKVIEIRADTMAKVAQLQSERTIRMFADLENSPTWRKKMVGVFGDTARRSAQNMRSMFRDILGTRPQRRDAA
jgi:Fe2+ transport system protein FeoA